MKATLILMALLVAGVNGQDEDFDNFIGGVYRKAGAYAVAGSTANGGNEAVVKAGNTYMTEDGAYVKAGNTYLAPNGNGTAIRAGDAFLMDGKAVIKCGDTYLGEDGATVVSGGTITNP